MKKLSFGQEGRAKLLVGADTLYRAVKSTLGPKGRNAVYFDQYGKPQITKDGIAVASQIDNLGCEFKNLGANIIRQSSARTANEAGDGTTTTTVLAYHMYKLGLEELSNGRNPVDIKREMEATSKVITDKLHTAAEPCDTLEKIRNVATISANNDKELGNLIAEAIATAGETGIVTIEDSPNENTFLESTEGMQFDRGFLSQYFANNKTRTKCTLDNPLIIVTEKKISTNTEVIEVLQKAATAGKPLLIIASDIEQEVIAGIATANKQGMVKACVIKSPGLGDLKQELALDICAATGATLLSEEIGITLENCTEEHFGTAEQVTVNKDSTLIVKGAGTAEAIEARVAQIQEKLPNAESNYQKEKLNERLAKLTGGIVVVRVGAITEVELIEKKARIEDALHATRAAIEEGIVAGSGAALAQLAGLCSGSKVVLEACKEPLNQILINSGQEDKLREILDSPYQYGYNLNTGEQGDLLKLGVIDPVKVTRNCLVNAVSVASMLLTTEVAIVEE